MDKKDLKFFGIFVALMIVILSIYFVMAGSYNQAPADAAGGTTISMIIFNVSNTSEVGGTTLNNITVNITGTASYGNVTNITLSGGGTTYYNDSFTSSPVVINVSAEITAETNFTVNFTLSSEAQYNLTLGANVTAISNQTNVSYSVLPYNSSLTIITDVTDPTATATCSSTEIYEGDVFPCTCSGTDSSYGSGVSTSTGSSTSGSTSDTFAAGAFTYTCTVTDVAGNSATATATYTVFSSGGVPTSQPPKKTHSWTKMTPGVATIMKDFDAEMGIKQIQIEVKNEAQNVKITVTKYDGKPAEVSVAKSGKVQKYLQIDAPNLEDKLDKATLTIQVNKSWVSNNALDNDKIALFKFNENTNEWEELTTTYTESDNDYYYYDVELTSFSYFAIGEKTVVEEEEEVGLGEKLKANLTWLWISIVALVIIVGYLIAKKKFKK